MRQSIGVGLCRKGSCCGEEEEKLREDVKSGIVLFYTNRKSNRCGSSHTPSANLSILVIDTLLDFGCAQQLAIFRIMAGVSVGNNVSEICPMVYQQHKLEEVILMLHFKLKYNLLISNVCVQTQFLDMVSCLSLHMR